MGPLHLLWVKLRLGLRLATRAAPRGLLLRSPGLSVESKKAFAGQLPGASTLRL